MSYVKRKDIALRIAYLIGVYDEFLERDFSSANTSIDELHKNKNASIVRYLCRLRTDLMKNFVSTDTELRFNMKNIDRLDWFSKDEIYKLRKWGVDVVQANYRAADYSKLFCKLIEDNIDACKELFPEWVNWNYIRDLFVIPNYSVGKVLILEYTKFNKESTYYPYHMYIHWEPFECKGMLLDDCLFLKSLYSLHNDKFEGGKNNYIEASDETKGTIYDFIDKGKNIVITVDCENSDVYKLFGFLNDLNKESLSKIKKIVLFDDINTVDTWRMLSNHISVPTEHINVERVVDRKSLVDMKMTAGICQSHYKDDVDSFILVSSDSDYWGVISSLPDARFMVVYEDVKRSNSLIKTLNTHEIPSCSIDDFYTGSTTKLKEAVLIKGINEVLDSVKFNCREIQNKIYKCTHIIASNEEKNAFYDKYLKNLKLNIDKEGNATVRIG